MGHAIANLIQVLGTSQNIHTSEEIRDSINEMVTLAKKSDITPRERHHVDAVNMFAHG